MFIFCSVAKIPNMDAKTIRKIFDYDPETGWFTNRETGRVVGVGKKPTNYSQINIDGRFYKAHRLVWLWVHGVWPPDVVDHLNGRKNDNRICNLEAVTQVENLQRMNKLRTSAWVDKRKRFGHIKNWSAMKIVDLEKL